MLTSARAASSSLLPRSMRINKILGQITGTIWDLSWSGFKRQSHAAAPEHAVANGFTIHG
ncbi:hypothetical protein PIIN_10939 [Serendipita indica DSM 11827]|uniref:Uncharacterized protein n=1 Tax=Serendipita indica (strain DSM 11827) TaxID=1109443 RepID=G4U063_SERID|nr:hypothetical protein PIIN_10939 [Serendipita indica DSM 11827]